jgi:S-formylglutathione hydrolase FrmB
MPLHRFAALVLLLPVLAHAGERTTVSVQLDPAAQAATGGRLVVYAVPEAQAAKDKDGKVPRVDVDLFAPHKVTIAAQEIPRIAKGDTVVADLDTLAFPGPYSELAPGRYYVQAVLDVDHDLNYSGRESGDWASTPVMATLGGEATLPTLTLTQVVRKQDPWDFSHPMIAPATRAAGAEARKHATPIDFTSPAVSRFYGVDTKIQGWVLTPPGYESGNERYPVVYMTQGWSATLATQPSTMAGLYAEMLDGRAPKMIWVLLAHDIATGAHEFTDSVNNGPWGEALVRELIPDLERRFRMDSKASGRFVFGHSSGGWFALSLQTAYPNVFGGAWATSPDPADFRDFTGPDLYAPNANFYFKPDGTPWPLVRDGDKDVATIEDMAKIERVQGETGGQLASFEAVFSPRGADGRPMPLFDRDTGAVDPFVAAYWRKHYDIAERIRTRWNTLKPDLDGKLHVVVGTADTFHLDGSARRLKDTLDALGAKSEFRFLEGRNHFDLYQVGDDRNGLRPEIAHAMYRVARPAAP